MWAFISILLIDSIDTMMCIDHRCPRWKFTNWVCPELKYHVPQLVTISFISTTFCCTINAFSCIVNSNQIFKSSVATSATTPKYSFHRNVRQKHNQISIPALAVHTKNGEKLSFTLETYFTYRHMWMNHRTAIFAWSPQDDNSHRLNNLPIGCPLKSNHR